MDEFTNDPEIEEMIAYLVEEGALIWDGMDEYGQPVYKVDLDIMNAIAPSLAKEHLQETENTLIDMYADGLLSIDFNDEGEAIYDLTPETRAYMEQHGGKLPEE